jgi:hypothetical protein
MAARFVWWPQARGKRLSLITAKSLRRAPNMGTLPPCRETQANALPFAASILESSYTAEIGIGHEHRATGARSSSLDAPAGMRTFDRATGAATGGRINLDRHRQSAFDRRPRNRGLFEKSIAVVTASILTVGLTAEMPAQAVLPRQAARIQLHAHQKRLAKRVRVSRHRWLRLGRTQQAKLKAAAMVAHHGWSRRHFSCLDRLWTRESGWNHRAYNRYTGAYGIPQANPAGKMRSAGRDWRTNPRTQIRWGLGYIRHRYGTPCRAWRHSEVTGWY